MIITVPKPFPEILEYLADRRSVFVVGCAACATKCRTGSEEAVTAAIAALEAAGKRSTGSAVLDTACDLRIARRDLGKSEAVKRADAVLVLACGAGVQAIEKVIDKPLVPGLNPVFIGTTERIGVYREFCTACGDCGLGRTAGICPKSRCAKSLANGPCGGVIDGKCEVDSSCDCAWVLIYNKLKAQGRERLIAEQYFPPKKTAKPRSLDTAARKP